MGSPKLSTIKTLFALSCNRCAFPGCDLRLADPSWPSVRADIAHIRGEKPGSARYAPDMTDEERNSQDNLMLLCPNHHRQIDLLEPRAWSADRLMAIKVDHENGCRDAEWFRSDADHEFYASLALGLLNTESTALLPVSAARPRLVVEREGDSVQVLNVSDDDAYSVSLTAITPSGAHEDLIFEDGTTLQRLSPGGRWQAAIYAPSLGSGPAPTVLVRWSNQAGDDFDGQFPV